MLAEITVQEVITYKKIIKITEEEFDDFLIDSPDAAVDMYNGHMLVGNAVDFDYINPTIKEYKTIRERKTVDGR